MTDWDGAAVRELAARMVTDELVIVGIRHHSPACARAVLAACAAHAPSVVLVEGPRQFTELVPLLAHPEAVPPLAVYSWAAHRQKDGSTLRVGSYYPLAEYSPELVALREAAARGIPARFIDLELAEQAVAECAAGRPGQVFLQDERGFAHSRALARLAARLGCHDHEDLWEHLLESGEWDLPEHIARLTAYCALARADRPAAELQGDGTTAREAEMAWHIRRALADRPAGAGPVLVVVGGFHAVALPDLLAAPPPRPTFRLGRGDGGNALIRFSLERLEALNGYQAGMTAPGWYQRLWARDRASSPRARNAAALDVLLEIARTLRRRHGLQVPTPAVAAAYEHVLRLADLRGHRGALRSDLLDAVTSCFVKGDADTEGALVRAVARRVLTGDAVGSVPPGAGTPPLVQDTLRRLAAARLKTLDTLPRTTNLDLYRSADHRATSQLLHGLALLGVPFATRTAGPDFVSGLGLSRLQERWDYAWTPATEAELVEASVLGSTLDEAVDTKLTAVMEHFASSGDHRVAGAAVALVARACLVGRHEHAAAALEVARAALAADVDFASVAGAAVRLALLLEAREPLEARRLTELPGLLRTAYERAIYLGRDAGNGAEPDGVVTALSSLRELLASETGAELDAALYWAVVESLAGAAAAPVVSGAATGLAYAAGRIDPAALGRAVGGHLGGAVAPAAAVAFTRGLLATAREAAWQEDAVTSAIDAHLAEWDEQAFIAHLPELRLAFAVLTPAETDRVARQVAAGLGLADLGPLVARALDEETMRRHLAVSAAVGTLLAEDGLAEWAGRA